MLKNKNTLSSLSLSLFLCVPLILDEASFYTPSSQSSLECFVTIQLVRCLFHQTPSYTLLFMMKTDFWIFKHCSDQLSSNKCDCARQVNSINVEMIATLSEIFIMGPWTFSCLSMSFIGHFEVTQSEIRLLFNGLATSTYQQEKG